MRPLVESVLRDLELYEKKDNIETTIRKLADKSGKSYDFLKGVFKRVLKKSDNNYAIAMTAAKLAAKSKKKDKEDD